MSEDTKLDFYLKHRQQIEEWAGLRGGARQTLDDALLAELRARAQTSASLIEVTAATTGVRYVRWRVPGAETGPVWVEVYWNSSNLLRGTDGSAWPYLVLVARGGADYAAMRARIKEASRRRASLHGLTHGGGPSSTWVWAGSLAPAEEPITVHGYVEDCLDRFEIAWTDLHPLILKVVQEEPDPSP